MPINLSVECSVKQHVLTLGCYNQKQIKAILTTFISKSQNPWLEVSISRYRVFVSINLNLCQCKPESMSVSINLNLYQCKPKSLSNLA